MELKTKYQLCFNSVFVYYLMLVEKKYVYREEDKIEEKYIYGIAKRGIRSI